MEADSSPRRSRGSHRSSLPRRQLARYVYRSSRVRSVQLCHRLTDRRWCLQPCRFRSAYRFHEFGWEWWFSQPSPSPPSVSGASMTGGVFRSSLFQAVLTILPTKIGSNRGGLYLIDIAAFLQQGMGLGPVYGTAARPLDSGSCRNSISSVARPTPRSFGCGYVRSRRYSGHKPLAFGLPSLTLSGSHRFSTASWEPRNRGLPKCVDRSQKG